MVISCVAVYSAPVTTYTQEGLWHQADYLPFLPIVFRTTPGNILSHTRSSIIWTTALLSLIASIKRDLTGIELIYLNSLEGYIIGDFFNFSLIPIDRSCWGYYFAPVSYGTGYKTRTCDLLLMVPTTGFEPAIFISLAMTSFHFLQADEGSCSIQLS